MWNYGLFFLWSFFSNLFEIKFVLNLTTACASVSTGVPVTHGNILHKITQITIVTLNKLLEEEDEHILDDDVLLEPQPEWWKLVPESELQPFKLIVLLKECLPRTRSKKFILISHKHKHFLS